MKGVSRVCWRREKTTGAVKAMGWWRRKGGRGRRHYWRLSLGVKARTEWTAWGRWLERNVKNDDQTWKRKKKMQRQSCEQAAIQIQRSKEDGAIDNEMKVVCVGRLKFPGEVLRRIQLSWRCSTWWHADTKKQIKRSRMKQLTRDRRRQTTFSHSK